MAGCPEPPQLLKMQGLAGSGMPARVPVIPIAPVPTAGPAAEGRPRAVRPARLLLRTRRRRDILTPLY